MGQYRIMGMSCAACVSRVEKAVRSVPGVTDCQVNLLTGSLRTKGTEKPEDILASVSAAGYRAEVDDPESAEMALQPDETGELLRRLIFSVCLMLPLMYLSMGVMMFNWPAPALLTADPKAAGIAEGILALAVALINRKFFINGTKGILHGSPNMDTLVALGSGVSFVYSAVTLCTASGIPTLYFESSAMILTLITVGKTLEARSKGRTADSLRGLISLTPAQARVERDGTEIRISADELREGEIFLIRAGERIPADGVVLSGDGATDESMLTGESLPVDKSAGDTIFCGTLNTAGFLRCRATRVGKDTALREIIRMVREASAGKAPVARLADRVASVFVPAVIGIAAVTALIWLLIGGGTEKAIMHAVSVLVISCPCAMGLATPVAIMVSTGLGARNGILFKTASAMETAGRTEIVALDKTGTVTAGDPEVCEIIPARGRETLERVARALEKESEHPLALAVRKAFGETDSGDPELCRFETLPGNGVRGEMDGKKVTGGSLRFTETVTDVPEKVRNDCERMSREGKTPILFTENGEWLGTVAVTDTLRKDSPEAVRQLQGMGIRVVMLTGDRETTARAIAGKVGIQEVFAGVLPSEKAVRIAELRRGGLVMMIGDGINDAPALKTADVSAAIGAGTDVAIDAADIVLMNDSLTDAAAAIRLGRAALRNIRQNLFWAFGYNLLLIPLAAGALTPWTELTVNPMLGALCMSLSSFCVVSNALRLNRLALRDASHDIKKSGKRRKHQTQDEVSIDMHVSGMMCPHCEATVRNALGALHGVRTVTADHITGRVTVIMAKDTDPSRLKETVEACDYTVTEMKLT